MKHVPSFRPILLLTGLCLAAFATPQGDRTGHSFVPLSGPEFHRHVLEQMEEVKAGLAAEKRGDYATAEREFRQACAAFGFDDTSVHIHLALLFDRMGDDRKAYREYHIAEVGDGRASFSFEEPQLLAHYGDLCVRFGSKKDAQDAYLCALAVGSRRVRDGWPVPVATDESVKALKAGAHVAAALEYDFSSGLLDETLRELNAAVLADGKNWVARIYRARTYQIMGHGADAIQEANVAESLTPSESLEQVRKVRRDSRIPDADGHLPPAPTPPQAPDAPKKG